MNTSEAPSLDESGTRIHAWPLGTVLRHQLGALVGTGIDFAVMIACVHGGASPVVGTAIGAACGALVNFALGRHWIFPAGASDDASPQAARYALVSLASLGLNTLGEHVVWGEAQVQFVVARLIVAALVSLGWNYPLQRRWVFAPRARV